MRSPATGLLAVALVMIGVSGTAVRSQERGRQDSPYLASPAQVVAVRAGRLFDAKAGTMLSNQVVVIRGDRIADVGRSVQIPQGARVIDLSAATVLPGMIDGHVHTNGPTPNESVEHRTMVMIQSAQRDLDAGFTTIVDMDSRGGFGTVELRNAINSGLVRGPRMQVAGQSLNPRGARATPNTVPGFFSGFTDGKNVNGPWLARGAVRELKLHGTDWAKIYTTQDFVGEDLNEFRPRRIARGHSVADARRNPGDRGRGASHGPEGRLSHVRRRRHALVRSGGRGPADAHARAVQRRCDDEAGGREEAAGHDDHRRSDGARRQRPEADRRENQPVCDGRAGIQEAARRRRAPAVRERRRTRAISPRQTGRPVSDPREVGHDARAGDADRVHGRRESLELWLGRSGGERRKGQVRRSHRRRPATRWRISPRCSA